MASGSGVEIHPHLAGWRALMSSPACMCKQRFQTSLYWKDKSGLIRYWLKAMDDMLPRPPTLQNEAKISGTPAPPACTVDIIRIRWLAGANRQWSYCRGIPPTHPPTQSRAGAHPIFLCNWWLTDEKSEHLNIHQRVENCWGFGFAEVRPESNWSFTAWELLKSIIIIMIIIINIIVLRMVQSFSILIHFTIIFCLCLGFRSQILWHC